MYTELLQIVGDCFDEFALQGEEGALSLTTKDRSVDAVVKGRPLNYVAGFRPVRASVDEPKKGSLTDPVISKGVS